VARVAGVLRNAHVGVERDAVVARAAAEREVLAQRDAVAQIGTDAGDLLALAHLQRAAVAGAVLEALPLVVLVLDVHPDLPPLRQPEPLARQRPAQPTARAEPMEGDDAFVHHGQPVLEVAVVPKPRICTRTSCAKLPLLCANTPGTRLSDSSRSTVGRAVWMASRSTTLSAAGTAPSGSGQRVAVTTMVSTGGAPSSACVGSAPQRATATTHAPAARAARPATRTHLPSRRSAFPGGSFMSISRPMAADLERARREANWARHRSGQAAGHYESFFQRANHPSRPLAFWIRYTLFSPHGRPQEAIGELWAVLFNGETGQHVAVKREVPIAQCRFDPAAFSVTIADARLGPERLDGEAASGQHTLSWDLTYRGSAPPLFLFPLPLYDAKFPKAKSLVGVPFATYNGFLFVDGVAVDVVDWVGSQNHNWGSQHTDHYAWGQVAGFDTHPDSFLEVATARLKFGPLWTPPLTPLVLRHRGEEFRLNAIRQTLRARVRLDGFTWQFRSATADVSVEGRVEAPRESFVGLRYYNPPGGEKHCLNSKLAACELRVTRGRSIDVLSTRHRAAFEILTDDRTHGIAIRA
jgi:hypothetical protein